MRHVLRFLFIGWWLLLLLPYLYAIDWLMDEEPKVPWFEDWRETFWQRR